MSRWEAIKDLFRKHTELDEAPQNRTSDGQLASRKQRVAQNRKKLRRRTLQEIERRIELERVTIPNYVRASVIDHCPLIPTCPNMLMREDTVEKLNRVMSKLDSLELD